MFKQLNYSWRGGLFTFPALNANNLANGNGYGLSCVLTTSNSQSKELLQ
jgi:hypothetical protein